MKDYTPLLTAIAGATVIGIAGVHHLRSRTPEVATTETVAYGDTDERLERLQEMLREAAERREAADEAERLVLGIDAGPLATDEERRIAAERWHKRLSEARRVVPEEPKPRAKQPNVREVTRVKTLYRQPRRPVARRSIFEQSRGYSMHGSTYPLRRNGRSRRYNSVYNKNRY